MFLKPTHSSHLPAYEDGTDSVPKHWRIKFRHWGITQKKAYNIQNTAKVRNQEWTNVFSARTRTHIHIDTLSLFFYLDNGDSRFF
jgi:hypothetical protein